MALRIGKIWNQIFSNTAGVQRKENTGKDENSKHQKDDQGKQQPEEDKDFFSRQGADKQFVEKAVEEFKTNEKFLQTGMNIQLVDTQKGLQIHLKQATGMTVRIMTAEDFLRMRQAQSEDSRVRGKILDQKF